MTEDVRPVHVCTCIAEGYMRFKPGQNSSSFESGPGSRAECCGAMCLASGQGRPARAKSLSSVCPLHLNIMPVIMRVSIPGLGPATRVGTGCVPSLRRWPSHTAGYGRCPVWGLIASAMMLHPKGLDIAGFLDPALRTCVANLRGSSRTTPWYLSRTFVGQTPITGCTSSCLDSLKHTHYSPVHALVLRLCLKAPDE